MLIAIANLSGRATTQIPIINYFFDKKNQLIADERLGSGTVDHAPVYPREVVRRALELSASAMVRAHNHPSGDPTPSRADIDMTQKIVTAAKALQIIVHDHMVVAGDQVAVHWLPSGTPPFRASSS